MNYHIEAGVEWPKDKNGRDLPTKYNDVLGLEMCESCWNGQHANRSDRCPILQCECGCYHGRIKGLNSVRPPAKSCKEQEEFPDVGGIDI